MLLGLLLCLFLQLFHLLLLLPIILQLALQVLLEFKDTQSLGVLLRRQVHQAVVVSHKLVVFEMTSQIVPDLDQVVELLLDGYELLKQSRPREALSLVPRLVRMVLIRACLLERISGSQHVLHDDDVGLEDVLSQGLALFPDFLLLLVVDRS